MPKPKPESPRRPKYEHPALLAIGLFFLVAFLYWEAQYYSFVGIDDHVYVFNNPYVLNGLTWDGIQHVFSRPIFSTYHPLTWVSLMADSTFFGLSEKSFHRTSIALHCVNTVLLFLMLRSATKMPLPAAFVAGLFAVHPLNVEPVAWVSSRKDVLSGLFFILGCWAHCAIPAARAYLRTTLVTMAYVLSILAKPSMVTFPFALLLLDYWPLGRFGTPPTLRWRTFGRLALEKAPMFVVMAISLGVTFFSAADSLGANARIPITTRAQDAIVNYAVYVGKSFVPIGLSAQYPYDMSGWPAAAVAGSLAVLLLITGAAWCFRKRLPYLAVGWLWFVGVLAPLCGIVIVGSHSRADRYMYIPIIGIAIALTWLGLAGATRIKLPALAVRIAALAILLAFTVASWREIPSWENEKTLAAKMLESHDWNPMGHYLMGKALEGEGDIVGAIRHFQEQLKLAPTDPSGHVAIGNTQYKLAAYDKAGFWYAKAAELSPDHAQAYYGLGLVAAKLGDANQARAQFERCLQLDPGYGPARQALAELDAGQTPTDLP